MESPNNTSKVSSTLLVLLILPVLGIAAAIMMAVASGGVNQGALGAMPQNAPRLLNWEAPVFQLTDLDGKTVSLTDYRGRIVFLNFWATWCEPCVRELPAFQTFLQEQGDKGAVVLAVNSDEMPDTINTFLKENGIEGLPVLLDTDGAAWKAYSIVNLPTTYVIDVQGMVRYMKLGEMKLDDMHDYIKAVSRR